MFSFWIILEIISKSSKNPEGMGCETGEVLLEESWEEIGYMHIYEGSLGRSPKEGKYPGAFCLWKEWITEDNKLMKLSYYYRVKQVSVLDTIYRQAAVVDTCYF